LSAFFLPRGEGEWEATEHTSGPWSPEHQHGGPPAALLARAMRLVATDPGMMFARLTFDLLGPVPVGPLTIEARVARPGRSVELVEASLSAGGREAMRAAAWRVSVTQAPQTTGGAAPLERPAAETPLPEGWNESGYLRALEWRFARGGYDGRGPAVVWTRMRMPLVPDEGPDPLTRVLVLADSGNGASAELSLEQWLFINPELTVHVHRLPEGEWICMDARTTISHGGAGLALSTLFDERGAVARGAQSLLIRGRGAALD
jgi:hypothetical protein